ncbi:E3 ubiquitin-protein ligase ubr1 [Pyricularia oryzae]|nr:hypothetical protein MCOR10_003673 [Pyricularia oryzae]KAI6534545.1 hypothetical protein MCOR05_006312 [Pyricularia oryzae]
MEGEELEMSSQERQLCHFLGSLPSMHKFNYTEQASHELLEALFWSMAGGKEEYMRLFFPERGGPLRRGGTLKLREAQGAVEGAEYTEAARGNACGHIFKPGEATYSCRTCSTDDTCCLCARCFDSTDHTGHMVRINISPGNSGCCDCGDPEAWKTPMFCTIHSIFESSHPDKNKGKDARLPQDLEESIAMTIGRVFDYLCDVISCSPEQLRSEKTKESILQDERMSRLSSVYGSADSEPADKFAVVLWNDEKHTHVDVTDQVARACSLPKSEGRKRADETDAIGRSVIYADTDLENLLRISKIIEQIKITVTIRSARDLFREQMCGTIIEWLGDIAGCTVGSDHAILRRVICEEMLKPWHRGSQASHAVVGEDGLYDHELEQQNYDAQWYELQQRLVQMRMAARLMEQNANLLPVDADVEDDNDDDDDQNNRDEDMEGDAGTPGNGDMDDDADDDDGNRGDVDDDDEDDIIMVDARGTTDDNMTDWPQGNIDQGTADQALEEDEAAIAGFPPPPPPPPATAPQPAHRTNNRNRDRDITPSDSDTAEPLIAPTVYVKNNLEIPKTPGTKHDAEAAPPKPGKYWLTVPPAYLQRHNLSVAEDLFQRVRLDWLVLFDLRLWKKVRNDLRSLYISTVVTIPEFKRVLGLRFTGLYTMLAQLYLIGDREPDHSIINISLQMLTTPSITAEIVERGNFLTTLMAILYTFLTMRQVGHPWDVNSNAVLAFETGTVTNRRMYHFFTDLKYLFGSQHVQERLRTEERYILQFLDLVKLHQGICPNTRAIGDHVEYETDTWINASLITREVNSLCKQFSESFRNLPDKDSMYLFRALRLLAKTVIINSIGAERARFTQTEVKDEVRFKTITDFEFDDNPGKYEVVRFVIEDQPISFHHALHYTLSWLIECGKSMPAAQLRTLLSFDSHELKGKPRSMGRKLWPRRDLTSEDYLIAALDYPLRVCAWLSQMKAGMWVRNGMSLRHQAGTYRGVKDRDVSHHRDIFLLQTSMIICNPSRVLASIIDRFGMEKWVKGFFEQKSAAQDDGQHLDVVEDMIHLLIVLLSDRTSLMPTEVEPNAHLLTIRRDITHVLCFKPLSFSEICNKMPAKYQENENFHSVLNDITNYKAPEGMSDVGTFELKRDLAEEIDPYISHYSKNQREEAENAYKKMKAAVTGRPVEDIVYEPKLRPIPSGIFVGLADFTRTGMFAQIVYYSLLYPLVATRLTPDVQPTRVETYLQMVLHLVLIAISEDNATEISGGQSFIEIALTRVARSNFMPDAPSAKTIVALLDLLATKPEFKACHPKVALILKRMRQKRPRSFETAYSRFGLVIDRVSTASPANAVDLEEERERKKRAAKERQARVMAKFQQQQKSFMENQAGTDFEYDDEDYVMPPPAEEQKNFWKYPSATCIFCQEDTDDRKLYGTFGFMTESSILRQTDLQDPDFVREAVNTPKNLDRSAEHIRPFGVAHENRKLVEKVNSAGETFVAERQTVGKGFPAKNCRTGPVSIGCGHIMHYACFEIYVKSMVNRHSHQIARQHPENTDRLEFVCPLCKALGNCFLPIIWKGKEESYPGVLAPENEFAAFLENEMRNPHYRRDLGQAEVDLIPTFQAYTGSTLAKQMADRVANPATDVWEYPEGPLVPNPRMSTSARYGSMFGRPTVVVETPRRPNPVSESGNPMKELVEVYRRLTSTLKINRIPSHHPIDNFEGKGGELSHTDTLARAVGFSISAAEIQQRGTDAEYGVSFLGKIPEQVLTHLRVFAETVDSYISIGGQKDGGDNRIARELRRDCERQHCQLFIESYANAETENSRSPMQDYKPLLRLDPFLFLCEAVFGIMRVRGAEIANLVRLCYLAEITKVVYHMGRNMPTQTWLPQLLAKHTQEGDPLRCFASFCLGVMEQNMLIRTRTSGGASSIPDVSILDKSDSSLGENRGFEQPLFNEGGLAMHYQFVRRYALVFLRKCAVLLHVRFGVDLVNHVSPSPELEEIERLTEALRLPSFDDMCASISQDDRTFQVMRGWIQHDVIYGDGKPGKDGISNDNTTALVSHPGIFELVGLPMNYDSLIDEVTRCKCPTTGREVSDPALCLHCGEVFCSQSICCLQTVRQDQPGRGKSVKRKIGGCQQHRMKCQGNVGLFINIRKCSVFVLHGIVGSWMQAPFIDKYGEADMGFRHGRQLFLHQKRYDTMLRNLWLSHLIPSLIARRLESDVNNGGWETI